MQHFANCNLSRFPTLWYDQRERHDGGVRWGLGIETTLGRHGFGWFTPMVDWREFRFLKESSAGLAELDRELLGWLVKRGGGIKDISQSLELCFSKLRGGSCSKDTFQKILLAMAHLCFRQFRIDVMSALKEELRQGEARDRAQADEIPLCFDVLAEVFVRLPNLVSGNKTRAQTPTDMVEWIWGDCKTFNRKFFTSKPFRIMYEKTGDCIRSQGVEVEDEWRTLFQEQFLRFHWILPYPDTNGTLLSTAKKGGSRQWWAVEWSSSRGYTWGRKKTRVGRPPPYPDFLTMEEEAFRAYVEQH